MIAGSDQFLNAGAEKTAFLGVVAGFVVLLLVFFLYLNKKWCFGAAANAFNCCDETQLSTQQLQQQASSTSQQSLHHQQSTSNNHHLYHQTSNGNNGYNNQTSKHHQYIFGNKTAYSLDSPESSSDSELDVIRRLQQSASFVTNHQRGPSNGGGGVLGLIGSPTSGTQALITASSHRPVLNSPPPLTSNLSNNQTIKTPIQSPRSPNESHDLISLVEKGRVGINNASNVSSCCSSTNSSLGAGQNQIRPISETHIHHAQMATHRAIAQDIRETRIDNFGDPDKSIQNGGHKYKKLTTDSSVESQSTDINSNSNSNQDCIVVLGQESCYDTDGQSICTSIGGGMERDANEITKDNGGGIQQDGTGNNTTNTSNNDKEVISKCGHLEVALLYDAPMRKMTVHVLQARDIPSRDRGQPTNTQVRLLLLPSKKQKHKTKIRSGDNPQYMESFLLHRINPEDVNSMGLRLRVYGCERMRREQLIGECVVSFSSLDLELETTLWLALEPRATSSHHHHSGHSGSTSVHQHGPLSPGGNGRLSGGGSNAIHGSSTIHGSISPTHHVDLRSLARSDSTGSAQSMQHGGVPELLLGLAYNATTGRLSVEIVKGSHFRNLAMNRAPDTYVKLCLVSSNGQEMARSKTSVRRGQPNPLFKETFVFQVALFQLADVTLMISVYNRKGMTKRKEMIGWFSLGLNSSGPEQLAHWLDMKDLHAQQLCRWHVLVDS